MTPLICIIIVCTIFIALVIGLVGIEVGRIADALEERNAKGRQ